jgi:hypothetical protein
MAALRVALLKLMVFRIQVSKKVKKSNSNRLFFMTFRS